MKKILVYGMTDNKGGIEAYIMNHYRLFDQSQLIFDFVTDFDFMVYADEVIAMGSRIHYVPSRRKNIFKHISGIRNIVKNGSYHAVYFNLLSAAGVFSIISLIGIKTMDIIVHSHNNAVKRMWLHRLCRPVLNMLADRRLACSEQAGVFMFGESTMRKGLVLVIKNAIDCERFQFNAEKREQTRKMLGIDEKIFVVGHVGRMCYQKNSLFIIDIFMEVQKRNPESVLLYVGEGEDRPLVEERIRIHGLENDVILLGMRDDVPELMQAMDVFLLPSRFEGFPVVGVEAQSAGLPCIFADTFTHTAALTEYVVFVDVNNSASDWANIILKSNFKFDRESVIYTIEQLGYCIRHQVHHMQKMLIE
jgi:glycosyltransferase involved in cell wall biosynthesis